MRSAATFFILLLFHLGCLAQQLSYYSQYREAETIINPAAVHHEYFLYRYNLKYGLTSRIQWEEVEGRPTTQNARVDFVQDAPGAFNLVMGANIVNDRAGLLGSTGVQIRLGALLANNPYYGAISVGISVGLVQYRAHLDDMKPVDVGSFVNVDFQSVFRPDVGIGAYYFRQLNNGDNLYTGISMPQTFALDFEYRSENGRLGYKRVPHYYLTAGYYKYINDESFIEPSIWVKVVPSISRVIDLNLRYQAANTLWIGLGWGSNGALHSEFGIILNESIGYDGQFSIGYAFHRLFNENGPHLGNTHEINMNYTIEPRRRRLL